MATSAQPVRRRNDALRNQSVVLSAAEQVFSRRGLSASLEEIAAEAGLGVGTVHRAFGSKRALIDALFSGRLDQVVRLIEDCAGASTGWEALRQTFFALTELQARDRAMQDLLFESAQSRVQLLRIRIAPLLEAIIDRAKDEGALRSDFAATDIPLLTRAASSTGGNLPGRRVDLARRHAELLVKGLAAAPDDEDIPAPLSDDDFPRWLGSTQEL